MITWSDVDVEQAERDRQWLRREVVPMTTREVAKMLRCRVGKGKEEKEKKRLKQVCLKIFYII